MLPVGFPLLTFISTHCPSVVGLLALSLPVSAFESFVLRNRLLRERIDIMFSVIQLCARIIGLLSLLVLPPTNILSHTYHYLSRLINIYHSR